MTDIMNIYQFLAFLVVAAGQAFLWWDNRSRMRSAEIKVEEVGHAVNGRTAELVKAAHEIGYLEGHAAAVKGERAVAVALLAPAPDVKPVTSEGEGLRAP